MISFVWAPHEPLPAGTGGTENYTVGQVRELTRRGIAAQVVTIGLGRHDGRDWFPGVPFHALATESDVASLAGTVVFVAGFPSVATQNPAYQILHVPPPLRERERRAMAAQTRDRALIVTSQFAAHLWSSFLDVDPATLQVVYPFAEPAFGIRPRTEHGTRSIRVLFAGRLSPEKGVYTLLEMLHSELLTEVREAGFQLTFTATTAGADKPQGQVIRALLEAHPWIRMVPAHITPTAMAAMMTNSDIVLMPSNSQYWNETFGIVSIEAQHAGCRVVASDDGGLPETDCGALILVAPDNPHALAHGLREAILRGPVANAQRADAVARFTLAQSVDQLLAVLSRPRAITPAEIVRELETIASLAPAPPLPNQPSAATP